MPRGKLSSHSDTTFCADMLKYFWLPFIIITNRTKQLQSLCFNSMHPGRCHGSAAVDLPGQHSTVKYKLSSQKRQCRCVYYSGSYCDRASKNCVRTLSPCSGACALLVIWPGSGTTRVLTTASQWGGDHYYYVGSSFCFGGKGLKQDLAMQAQADRKLEILSPSLKHEPVLSRSWLCGVHFFTAGTGNLCILLVTTHNLFPWGTALCLLSFSLQVTIHCRFLKISWGKYPLSLFQVCI